MLSVASMATGLLSPASMAAVPSPDDVTWVPLSAPADGDTTTVAIDDPVVAVASGFADVGGVQSAGAVRVHRRGSDGTWASHDLTAPGGPAVSGRFGLSGLVVDGDRILVASRSAVSDYRWTEAGPVYQGDIVATTGTPRIAAQGPVVVVGESTAEAGATSAGKVLVLVTEPNGSTRTTTLTRPGAPITGARFGQSVAISGEDIVVSAANGNGEVWVFHHDGNGAYVPERLPDPGNLGGGTRLAMSLTATPLSIFVDLSPLDELVHYHREDPTAPWAFERIEEPHDVQIAGDRFGTVLAASGAQVLAARGDAAPVLLERSGAGSWSHGVVGEEALPAPLTTLALAPGRIVLGTQSGAVLGSWPVPPGRPDVFAAASPSAPRTIEATWQVTDPGGTRITSIDLRADAIGEPTRSFTYPGDTRSATLTGLSDDTEYHIAVRAVNDDGPGPWGYASAWTPGPPSAPRQLTATTSFIDRFLRWQPPASDGRSDIAAYTVHRDGVLIATVEPATTEYRDVQIVPNATHRYEVRAVNVVGPGEPAATCSEGWLLAPDCA